MTNNPNSVPSQDNLNHEKRSEKESEENTTADKNQQDRPIDIPEQGSSSPMGGLENNITGNSADRQGDDNNRSGGSYQKSNKNM